MVEQWPFKPLVDGSSPSELIKQLQRGKILDCHGNGGYRAEYQHTGVDQNRTARANAGAVYLVFCHGFFPGNPIADSNVVIVVGTESIVFA